MNKECTNLCRVAVWVEEAVFWIIFAGITSIKRFTLTPTTATDNCLVIVLSNKLCLVLNQLTVNPKDCAQCAFNLL
jgi:hypothetical protein